LELLPLLVKTSRQGWGAVIQDSTMAESRTNIATSNTPAATAAAVASLDSILVSMDESTYQQTSLEEKNNRPSLLSKTNKSTEKKTKSSGTSSTSNKTTKQG